jgi:DNA primase
VARIGDNDNRQRVLDASRIERVIGDHITLKPKGRELVCLCPFHADRNPSMYVVPAKQIFHCFVCGAGGNAIDFVMKFHGMEFRAALEFLAQKAGIELVTTRRAPSEEQAGSTSSSRQQVLEANALALRFYRGILAHPEHGAAARAVIEKRGIAPAMVEEFGLGAAPDRWDGLVAFANSKNLPLQALIDAGLIKPRQSGDGCFDMLRHRLIFPIFDQIGRPVAFGGRKLRDEDEPKYLNSPESKVFDKSGTLFGLKQALRTIQETRTAIVTEGYTDVIACHQAGIANVVATLGTATTPKHAAILRRLCDKLILLFDGDEAGQRAADRALEVFFGEPIDVKIAVMSGGKDPDELLKKEDGREAFQQVLDGAVHFLDFRFTRLRHRLDERGLERGGAARAAALDEEIDRLVELGLRGLSPLRQQAVIGKLAAIAGVDAATIVASLARRGRAPSRPGEAAQEQAPQRRTALEQAVGCLLCDANLAMTHPTEARDVLSQAAHVDGPLADLAEELLANWSEEDGAIALDALLLDIESGEVRGLATALAAETDRLTDNDAHRLAATWRECVKRLELDAGRPKAPAGGASVGGVSNMADLAAALERSRTSHERLGSNPLAMPRPRTSLASPSPN